MTPLPPLRFATDINDLPHAYLYNMEQCRVCYIRYEELIRAVQSRQPRNEGE